MGKLGRPPLPRQRLCRYCLKDLLDPALDNPSQHGRHPRYHYRCYKRALNRARRLERIARRAWLGLRPGERVRDQDYKNVMAGTGNRARRVFKTEGPYHHKQTCACGASYIGGANAVRCPLCQVRHARAIRRRWNLLNAARVKAYNEKWRRAHPAEMDQHRRASYRRVAAERKEAAAVQASYRRRDQSRAPRLPRGGPVDAARPGPEAA
jgi:hypothetical protein